MNFFPADLQQPFVKSQVETILVTESSADVIVPCLVSIPELNVSLYQVSGRPLVDASVMFQDP